MAHVNLIPLNPTGGYGGGPTGRANVEKFVEVLQNEFGISATPRMRRGIDIDAGCGQLKSAVKKKEDKEREGASELLQFAVEPGLPTVGVYEDEDEVEVNPGVDGDKGPSHGSVVEFSIDEGYVDLDDDDDGAFNDPMFEDDIELAEAERLISLVKGTTLAMPRPALSTETSLDEADHQIEKVKPTTITDDEAVRKAKRRRKKLLKQLKAVQKLKELEQKGKQLTGDELAKVAKGEKWKLELDSVEHNLM